MTTEARSCAADLELRGADGRTVFGIAAPFNQPAEIRDATGEFTEVIRPGAFARTIRERGSRIKLLALHNSRQMPLGRATTLREDANGLYIEAKISATSAGDEAIELIRDGALDGFSIGFQIPTGGARYNRDGIRELNEIRLNEVSLVSMPAYEGALVGGIRAMTDGYDPRLDPSLLLRQLALISRK